MRVWVGAWEDWRVDVVHRDPALEAAGLRESQD